MKDIFSYISKGPQLENTKLFETFEVWIPVKEEKKAKISWWK